MQSASQLNEENISQKPAIKVLEGLGYQNIHADASVYMRGNTYNVVLKDVLKEKLIAINGYSYKGQDFKFSEKNINQAISDIDESLADGLIKTNEKIHTHLLYGKSYSENLPDGSKRSFNINYIDWNTPENNDYQLVEEFSVDREDGKGTARPDIVLFINGIPFAVIECKKSSISIDQGISQMLRNQSKNYLPNLFKFTQITFCCNKNDTKYATCKTPKKFWSLWKEESTEWQEEIIKKVVKNRIPTRQDKDIVSLFHPERVLQFILYFTLFDKNIKKIARYQQYFAIKEIIKTIELTNEKGNRQSGVIWHTQGSGKSLTMVMLARYILSEMSDCNPQVVVVTDRIDLDKQIHKTFTHSRLKASRAKSAVHLVELLNNDNVDIATTLVHKFDNAVKLQNPILSKDIFVLIDESHRTQYGELHIKMKQLFPNACYLGFTGTPLMKKEKNTMIKFGMSPKPIHTYTIKDAVNDKAIVPLLYEGKMIDQTVNKKAIDKRLEMICRNLNDKQKIEVQKKWSLFEKIASSEQRINLIAFDINDHFLKNYKTDGIQYKAMLATNSKNEAIRYFDAFEELGDLNTAIVFSAPDKREGYEAVDAQSKDKVLQFWNKMLDGYKDEEDYEESIKNEFIEGDELDLLIVVDKLLTGFDAPRATVLYIDKPMKEHTLLQAIARVNRLYEGKDFGRIIDYRGLLEKLDTALEMYSGAGLDNFDEKDIEGAIYDVISIVGTLRHYHAELVSIFKTIKNRNDIEAFEVLLAIEDKRNNFYDILSEFGRNMAIAMESEKVYNALSEEELTRYKKDLKFYQELRKSVKLRYSDSIDHKEYEVKMQKLMDNYISAEDIIRITNPVDILNEKEFQEELDRLGSKRAKADAIRTRLSQSISKKWDENPELYKKFSQRIQETIDDYKNKRISEAEYLKRMNDIKNDYSSRESNEGFPEVIHNNYHAQAFYGVVESVVEESNETTGYQDLLGDISLKIYELIKENSKVDWHDNEDVHKKIEQAIEDLLHDSANGNGLKLSYEQIDKINEKVRTIALRRF